MSLNINFLIWLFFFVTLSGFSQGDNEEPVETRFRGGLSLSTYSLIPSGDSFVKDGLKLNSSGFQFGFDFFIAQKVIIGTEFRFIDAENIDEPLLGNYESTSINSYNFKLGYRFPVYEKYVFIIAGTVGNVNYRNDVIDSENFKDSGSSVGISAELAYNIFNELGVFLKLGYRSDNLKIKFPNRSQTNFDNASYFSLSLGVKLNFVNNLYQRELDEEQREREEDIRRDEEASKRRLKRKN